MNFLEPNGEQDLARMFERFIRVWDKLPVPRSTEKDPMKIVLGVDSLVRGHLYNCIAIAEGLK